MIMLSDITSKLKSLKRHVQPYIKNPFELIEKYFFSKEKLSKEFFLYLICYCLSLTGFVYGFIMTQSNILLLLANINNSSNNNHHTTQPSSSTISSTVDGNNVIMNHETILTSQFITILYFGEMFGAIISFPFIDNFGRKYTLIFACLFCLIMLIWTMFTESFHHLYTFRFFIGISLGFMMTISPIYIAEVATHTERGQCISFLSFNNILGSIVAITSFHILSYFQLSWKWSFFFPILLICCQIYIIAFLPDSPRWLLAKKTPSDCSVSLQHLRRSPDISREFNILYRALSSDARLGDSWLEIILSKTIRIRLFITILMQIIPQFIGIQMIIFFGYEIMKEMNIQQIFMGILLIYASGLIGTIYLFLYIEKKGRHFLLSIGNNAIGVIWILLACLVYVKIDYLTPPTSMPMTSPTPTTITLATSYHSATSTTGGDHPYLLTAIKICYLFFLCLFYANYYLSWGSIGWIYSAEIFPYRARAKAMSITTSIHYASALLACQLLQTVLQSDNQNDDQKLGDDDITALEGSANLMQAMMTSTTTANGSTGGGGGFYPFANYFDLHNIAQCFLILGLNCFIVNIVIYLMIPETSGCMIEEMEEVFKIEHLSYCCGCLPRYRGRSILPPGNNSSLLLLGGGNGGMNYNSLGTTTPYSMIDGDGNGDTIGDEDTTIYEPKLLHKYSRDMKESKFTYYHETKAAQQHLFGNDVTPIADHDHEDGVNHSGEGSSMSQMIRGEKEGKFRRSIERFDLIPDDPPSSHHHQNTSSTVSTYTDFVSHSDEGSEGSDQSDQEVGIGGGKGKTRNQPSYVPRHKGSQQYGSASKGINTASTTSSFFSLPPPGSSSRRYHSSSFSSLPTNSSSKKSMTNSTFSQIGTTLYESLFNSGSKKNSSNGGNGGNNGHSTSKSANNSVSRNNGRGGGGLMKMRSHQSEDSDYIDDDENEEHFEPLIESFAMKLPFHDK